MVQQQYKSSTYIKQAVGPLFLTALSFLLFSWGADVAGKFFISPNWNILASRGFAKILFTLISLSHLGFFLFLDGRTSFPFFARRNMIFYFPPSWFSRYMRWWTIFFSLHLLVLLFFIVLGDASLNYNFITSRTFPFLFCYFLGGCLATFFLALTEEIIFRGSIFPYVRQYASPLTALFITSFIFSACHGLPRPDLFLWNEPQVAIGLFLFGCLLNAIYLCMGRLYYSMAAHAGMVSVKVLMRKIPFITFSSTSHWWVHPDGRQAFIIHILFCFAFLFFIFRFFGLSFFPLRLRRESA